MQGPQLPVPSHEESELPDVLQEQSNSRDKVLETFQDCLEKYIQKIPAHLTDASGLKNPNEHSEQVKPS